MQGNEALGEGAIRAGCRFYAGYPITPQNELTEYMAVRMPEIGGTFIQAESELAAIYMVFGASVAGARAMTSSSSPGISLKQEGISYLAGAELPALIVNVMRGGPGLGNIAGAQSDYFQATKGGGHGDYHLIVLAPATVQEMLEFPFLAFDLAEKYRNPAMILTDGYLAQMFEPVTLPEFKDFKLLDKEWVLSGCVGRAPRTIKSFYLEIDDLEKHNEKLQQKYLQIKQKETRFQSFLVDDAEFLIVAFGTAARVAKAAVLRLREDGIKIGLVRPITLFPFPENYIYELADQVQSILVIEMNTGQMVEDVRVAVNGKVPVHFYGRTAGGIPSVESIVEKVLELTAKKSSFNKKETIK